ncbi:MAG: sensor histidine kinase N-terminal domain-containing protein [Gammaproteobacteria bacterium]|nr:sensor histidine kinase N-terminal domain-containing protein [Gammaproteobacteria bacterium]
MYSIRNRLSYRIIIAMILVLSVMSALLYYRVAGHVQAVFDQAVYDKAQALISLTELDEEGLEFDFAEDGVMLEFVDGQDQQYYQLWEAGGTELIRSPSLQEHQLPMPGLTLGQHRFDDIELADGRAGRMIAINFMPRVEFDEEEIEDTDYQLPEARPIVMVFARERMSLDDTLYAVGWSIFLLNILVIIFVAALIWQLVGRGLAPLSNLARQVSGIDESNLDARLSHSGEQSRELAPIEHQLNHLLERMQSAFEREKRFSANVAHELRTPLSELKTLAEVGRMVPEDQEQIAGFFEDVGDISSQMEKVVVTLLELTRSEAGLLQNEPEDILLFDYCEHIWRHAVNGSGREKLLINQVPRNLVVHSDADKLGMILSNLFINAVCYSPDQAEVKVRTVERDGRLALEVQNATTDLKPEDIVHMKDRFWRKNKAQEKAGHSGLGLTLVDALARIMQMDIKLDLDDEGIFHVRLAGLQVTAG